VKTVGNKTIYIFVSILGFFFLSTLVFVSLLGENNKIDATVHNYFKNVQAQEYFSEEDNLKTVADLDVFDIEGEFSENCFLLEFALLEKYGLIESQAYDIVLEKDIFWIPFSGNSSVNVSVSLHPSRNSFRSFIEDDAVEVISGLFTVKKINGLWRIASINVKDSALLPYVKSLRKDLVLESYVKTAGEKLIIMPVEIDTGNATIFEKRKLSYIFQKVNHLIQSSEK